MTLKAKDMTHFHCDCLRNDCEYCGRKLPSEIIQPPTTLQDFEAVKKSIVELMGNPYCDQFMFLSLSKKLKNVNKKIEELKK
jgi:hypothetical protein